MGGDRPGIDKRHAALSHEEVSERMYAYVADVLAGREPARQHPDVAAHLATCAACRADYEELLALTRATYADDGPLPPVYPTPDLTPLRAAPAPTEPRQHRLDELGRFIVELGAELIARTRPSPLIGLARSGALLYDLQLPAEMPGLPDLRVEAAADDESLVALRVWVDLPHRDPLDSAAGTAVVLLTPVGEWHATTDAAGVASFGPLPHTALHESRLAVALGPDT